jgi:hypothetical protein
MPLHNLDTVRDTLARIQANLRRVPALSRAAEQIEKALMEMAVIEPRQLTRFPARCSTRAPISGADTDSLIRRRPHAPAR